MGELKPPEENRVHGERDNFLSWFQVIEAKKEQMHESAGFADEERKKVEDVVIG